MAQATATVQVPTFISDWVVHIEPMSLAEAVPAPDKAAVVSTDMIVGFCQKGALSSERVGNLVEPIIDLFRRCHDHGIRHFVLNQDTHEIDTPEFGAWPVHCVRGTDESETVPEFMSLPFADDFHVFPKNSIAPGFGSKFEPWVNDHPELTTMIVVGNCTDLCVYQLAMYLRLRANALNIGGYDVIIPADCVDTFDLPVEPAGAAGAMPHPGDFFHEVFLYHLGMNGVRVVQSLT